MKKIFILVSCALLLTATACKETTSEKVEIIHDKPATVIVPEKKVNVNVHNDAAPAPVIINHDSKTSTTTSTDDTGSVKTEVHTETVH